MCVPNILLITWFSYYSFQGLKLSLILMVGLLYLVEITRYDFKIKFWQFFNVMLRNSLVIYQLTVVRQWNAEAYLALLIPDVELPVSCWLSYHNVPVCTPGLRAMLQVQRTYCCSQMLLLMMIFTLKPVMMMMMQWLPSCVWHPLTFFDSLVFKLLLWN